MLERSFQKRERLYIHRSHACTSLAFFVVHSSLTLASAFVAFIVALACTTALNQPCTHPSPRASLENERAAHLSCMQVLTTAHRSRRTRSEERRKSRPLSLNYNDEHLDVASDRRSRPRGANVHPEALFLDSIHHPSDCPNTCTTITTTTTTTDGISARVVRRRSAAAGQHARLLFTEQHSRPICATAARTRHHAPAVSTTSSHCAQHRQHL